MPSPQLLRLIVADLTEVVSRFRADGTLTYVNEVYCRFFGKPRAALIGHKWHPQAVAEDLPHIHERLALLSPQNPVVLIENRIYDAQGEVHWMQFVNRALFDTDGTLLETQSVGRDITDRKRVEEELQLLNNQLEERIWERTASLSRSNLELLQEINERKEAEAARHEIEEALHSRSRELEETNNALRVLIRQREQDQRELEKRINANLRELILPYLQALKKTRLPAEASACLNVIQANLDNIVSSFAGTALPSWGELTPKERLVANLVREGEPDKAIAQALGLSLDTVKAHRRNIRKKLGLTGGKTNLHAFLANLQNR